MTPILSLIKMYRPYWGWLFLGIFISLISLLANTLLMGVSGWFIAAMSLAGVTGSGMNYFTPASMIRGSAIIRTGGRYAERLVTHEATFHFLSTMRRWLYEKVENLPPSKLARYRSGDVLARFAGDIDTLERFYLSFLVPVSVALLSTCILSLFVTFVYDMRLGLNLFFWLFVAIVFPFFLLKLWGGSEEKELVADQAALKIELSSSLQGMRELLVYDPSEGYKTRIDSLYTSIFARQARLNVLSLLAQNSVSFFAGLGMTGVVFLSYPLLEGQFLTGRDLPMMLLLTLVSFEPLASLPAAWMALEAARASARRIFGIVQEADEPTSILPKPLPLADDQRYSPARFSLDVQNLSFSYERGEGRRMELFKNASFSLPSGKIIAIKGPTGSGKTTFIDLLLGFETPLEGTIQIAGSPSSSYSAEDLRRFFSVVLQKPYLFSGTIEENLKIANPTVSREEMDKACEIAGIKSFIMDQPEGYTTMVGEQGTSLSGGQIKRLALAQSLLRRAPCLILDELAEGLDYETEQDILARILACARERGFAIIMMTHRGTGGQRVDHVFRIENAKFYKETKENFLR